MRNDMELQTETKPKKSIRYYAQQKANDLITEFEYNMDIFMDNKRAKFSPIQLIKEKKASAFSVQKVLEYYSRIPADELNEFCHPREKLFIELVQDDCNRFLNTKNKMKKQRLPKEKPAEQVVAKLNYMRSYENLNLVSVEPTTIIKSQTLVTYNIKTRKLSIYIAEDKSPFTLGVSRSSITQYSEKSMQKTLRDPVKQMAKLLSGSTTTLMAEFNKIKAKVSVPSGRINQETILVASFQV
jgi:hypothetical protein